MPKFLPLFPLKLIVFPGEDLNLHIFEPRYKQLIRECSEGNKTFGIPPFIKNNVAEYGTEMEILEISKTYDNGEMDIKTRGVHVIRILEFMKVAPAKLYPAGVINSHTTFPENNTLRWEVKELIQQLHSLMGIKGDVFKSYDQLSSYDVAHYLGMNLDQQYHMLCIESENLRQNLIYKHLRKLIPTLIETEKIKKKISANGHFRNIIPPEL